MTARNLFPARFRVGLAMLALLGVSLCASAAEYSIHAEVWARPRRGDELLQLPALRGLLNDYERAGDAYIEIRYPGGEAGVLWAQELQDWLVALGVPSQRIRTQAGSGVPDSVELLIKRGE